VSLVPKWNLLLQFQTIVEAAQFLYQYHSGYEEESKQEEFETGQESCSETGSRQSGNLWKVDRYPRFYAA
jgi:hypothetical protein